MAKVVNQVYVLKVSRLFLATRQCMLQEMPGSKYVLRVIMALLRSSSAPWLGEKDATRQMVPEAQAVELAAVEVAAREVTASDWQVRARQKLLMTLANLNNKIKSPSSGCCTCMQSKSEASTILVRSDASDIHQLIHGASPRPFIICSGARQDLAGPVLLCEDHATVFSTSQLNHFCFFSNSNESNDNRVIANSSNECPPWRLAHSYEILVIPQPI